MIVTWQALTLCCLMFAPFSDEECILKVAAHICALYIPKGMMLAMKTQLAGSLPKLKLNSVALIRERTLPTEPPPLVGHVSANFCG
jgi:hypothetical protein